MIISYRLTVAYLQQFWPTTCSCNQFKGATLLTNFLFDLIYFMGYYRTMKNTTKGITMTNAQRRTAINKKIKSAYGVYIYNNWAEQYFKSTKEELLNWFSYRYKRQAESGHGQVYMNEFLTGVENNIRISEDNWLHFN